MKNTRILHVSGEDDFGAINFENEGGISVIEKELEKDPTQTYFSGEGWFASISEFDDIDDAFLSYVKANFIGYDQLKDETLIKL